MRRLAKLSFFSEAGVSPRGQRAAAPCQFERGRRYVSSTVDRPVPDLVGHRRNDICSKLSRFHGPETSRPKRTNHSGHSHKMQHAN
jgi:hypothetical protein